MRGLFPVVLLVALALSGCASDGAGSVRTQVITPGTWDVRSDTDHILAWAHNEGARAANVTWSLTGKGGTALPTGWNVTFSSPGATLEPDGTKVRGSRGYAYQDWTRTLVTLQVPDAEPAGTHTLRLGSGTSSRDITVTVHGERGEVSHPGSTVSVQYEGRFHDSGDLFDEGQFSTRLGSGQTVPGFDYGLMGLAEGETQTIVIPAALAYGYDNPPGDYERFNGETLAFKVTIADL